MAKISELALASVLAGDETVPVVQGGEMRRASFSDMLTQQTAVLNAAGDTKLTQINDLGTQVIADVTAAGLTAQTYAAMIPSVTGIGSASVTVTVLGTVTPNALGAGVNVSWSTGRSWPFDGTMTCRVRTAAAGTYTCAVVDFATRKPLKIFTGIAMSAGLNSIGSSVFGDYIRPAGSVLTWTRTSGTGSTGIAYNNAGGTALQTTTTAPVVGTAVNGFTVVTNVALAIEETVTASPATLNRRVSLLERATAGWGRLRTRITGTLSITSPLNAATTSIYYEFLSTDPCILDTFEFDVAVAGPSWGYIAIDIRNGDGSVSPYMVWPLDSVVDGPNTVNFGGLPLPAGAMVAYRPIAGNGAKYQNGVGMAFTRSVLTTGVGEAARLFTTAVRMAYRATVREPTRRKRVFARRAYGPVLVEAQTFAGTSTPEGWTLGSAFSISDGLMSSGSAGAWDNVATFDAGGGQSSSISRRLLIADLIITDPTSIYNIGTRIQTGGGSLGCVAKVDCTTGKLYLESWAGSSAAGSFVAGTEVNLPAATLAAIAASSTNIPLTLKLEKNGPTVTASAIDPVTAVTASVTETLSAATEAAVRLMHGRPSLGHRQGAVKCLRFSAYHNVPFDCGTAIAGDSNAEGIYGDTLNTWAQQAVAASARVVLSARGGATTAEMFQRADDILTLRADRWILALGTNESAQATWRVNMASLIDLVRATGAEPILTTFMPNEISGAQALMNSLNADVLAYYFGNYRYVDLAAATSAGNARTAWNGTMRKNANHANQTGQNASFLQAQVNIPDLLL